jgi:isoleucyl-tRNA synthetase
VLHRMTELDARLRKAVRDYDWTGVYPDIHGFCSTDLSAFYFDIRKDALYCDAADSHRRRSARTVLDVLHRCLCAWLAPVLTFTAEEAWLSRFPSETDSVHLHDFPELPAEWRDEALAERWAALRTTRATATGMLEELRRSGEIGSSLQAKVTVAADAGYDRAFWEEILIVSQVERAAAAGFAVEKAPGTKCDRCWRVLPEVGESAAHPTLCRRCDAVVGA